MKSGFDYPPPIFCCQIIFFLSVEPPITMRTVEVADIIDINRAVHGLFCLEKLVSCYFLENANVKWHFP
jgi:hypothetical protein